MKPPASFPTCWTSWPPWDSPDQIADFFRQEQIQGVLWHVNHCPVATYITRETGERALVTPSGSLDHSYGGFVDATSGGPLPESVNEFATQFDKKAYPDLIQE